MINTADIKATNAEEFDPRDFRNALGQYPTGVTIITTLDNDGHEDIGMTMNSFSAVSLDPPLVLFSVDKGARSLEAWQFGASYGISVLSEGQHELASQFAKSLGDKWGSAPICRGKQGVALVKGAIAQFECSPFGRHEAGDHMIFIARVEQYSYLTKPGPLAFSQGRFSHLQPGPVAPPDWPLPIHY
jgi:flavin reductase (DIM6/NTAB) family NADH-FMN oxidoreductase RutF